MDTYVAHDVTELVVLSEPDSNDSLGMFRVVEPFRGEHFSTKCSSEALVGAVLLG